MIYTELKDVKMIGVCQALSDHDINNLHDEYAKRHNVDEILDKVCTKLFRNKHIRTLSDLDAEDEGLKKQANDIMTDFCEIQAQCVTRYKQSKKKVFHKKGDVIRDPNGEPVLSGYAPDGKTPQYRTYPKDFIEYVDDTEEVPYYDYKNSPTALDHLKKFIKNVQVLPDLTAIKSKMAAKEDFQHGLDLIRKITDYYVFEDVEAFIKGFALLICNAKAKALNEMPKFPILFSIVSYDHGVGKSWFRDVVAKTYDDMFECRSILSSYRALLDTQFNSIMLTRGFVKLDEKNMLDQRKNDTLKSLISEPTVSVNRKHLEIKESRNLVTFFSCTNETIKDVVGLQQDRRLLEVRLLEKKAEMPEDTLVGLMNELWRVMPYHCPIENEIYHMVKDESMVVLDSKMYDIVSELFGTYQSEFVSGKFVSTRKLKESIKKIGNIRSTPVIDWCVDKGVLRKYKNSSYGLVKANLEKVMKHQNENVELVNSTIDSQIADIDEAEKGILTSPPVESSLEKVAKANMSELLSRGDISDEVKQGISNNTKLMEVGKLFEMEGEL